MQCNSKKYINIWGGNMDSKQKHRNKLLATEMDYLRRSARISRRDKIRNEAIRTKIGTKKTLYRK
jgi:hypothetical protein